jgi:PST family polysaccharide transporter
MLSPKDKVFSADHLKSGLKERAIKSTAITLAAQGIKLVLQLGSVAIMSRLLQPSDFGLIAMVTVFTGLALQFMEGGLSMATIQRDQITHAQVSNLFWVNGALGAVLCLIGILISPLVAGLYDEPRLTMVMAVMSIIFLIGGLSVQHDALLRRQMRFRAISVIDITSMVAGIIAGITAALSGLEYWSLVISTITTLATKTAMRWLSARWVPSMMSRGSGVRPLLGFGANLTGANFIGYFANNVTPFAIGYIGGAVSLGLYNRANNLTSIPSSQLLPPIINVLQPTVSRIADNPQKLNRTMKSLMGKLALVATLITLTMALFADWIVLLLLGPSWTDTIPLFRLLAVYSFIQPLAGLIAVALIAAGEARAMMASKLHSLIITVIALLIGSNWGVFGIVLAFSLSGLLIRLPVFLYYASRFLPLSFLEFSKPIFPALACALLTMAVMILTRSSVEVANPLIGLLVFVPACVIVYVCMCLIIKPARVDLLELIISLRLIFQRKSKRN